MNIRTEMKRRGNQKNGKVEPKGMHEGKVLEVSRKSGLEEYLVELEGQ